MEKRQLERGEIMQINPGHAEAFGGCLMVVTNPKPWGAQGYVLIPGGASAHYRCSFTDMEPVGRAAWVVGGDDDD
jgi:hypothetical protein